MNTERPKVNKQAADHICGQLLGIKEGDDALETAEKAVAAMKAAGMSRRTIIKAEKMVELAKEYVRLHKLG